MRFLRWIGLVSVAGATACSGGTVEPPGTIGELGEGTFHYICVDEGDAVCNKSGAVDTGKVQADLGIQGQAPEAIAVGARFDLTYSGDTSTDDGDLLLVETKAARQDQVTATGGFIIEVPGVHAFLARSPKGIIADFLHVEALVAVDLDVWLDEQRVEAVTLKVGEERMIAVVPQDGTGVSLAGALPYEWVVDGAAVAIDAVDNFGPPTSAFEINDDEVRIYGQEEGTATITVARDDVQKQIQVIVEPQEMLP